MAQIRIVDDWLRSPAAGPSHWRSVMVIAEKWAEQRVLMRAYAESRDQTRPTIWLHGVELAIGPAGLDVNGAWGIHVGDNADGRAQQIREHLEGAARRIAGSKGNPPRLADEEPTFDREPTANWGPGAPRMLPQRPHAAPHVDYVAPVAAARVPQAQAAQSVPAAGFSAATPAGVDAGPSAVAPSNPELRKTPLPRSRTRTRQTGALTAHGHTTHAQGAAGHGPAGQAANLANATSHTPSGPGAYGTGAGNGNNVAYGTGAGAPPVAYGTGPDANLGYGVGGNAYGAQGGVYGAQGGVYGAPGAYGTGAGAYGTGAGGQAANPGTGPYGAAGAYNGAAAAPGTEAGANRDPSSTEAGGFGGGGRTSLGYQSGSGAQSALVKLGLAPHVSARLSRFVDRVVPLDFHIDPRERRVLNALGERELTARAIGQMVDLVDAVAFMEELVRRLESYRLDLVEPGEPHGGEPTYRLRT